MITKITLLLLALTTMMSNVAVVTVIPHLKDYFQADNIELLSRLMLTLPSIVIAFLAPFLGHIVHKFGKKNSALFALLLFALAGTAGLYLETLNLILASRALLGVSIATLMIVSTSLVGDYFQGEKRNRYMGLQNAFTSVGGLFFVVGGGVLSDINWRYPFAIYLIGAVLFPIVYKFLVEKKEDEIAQEQDIQIDGKLLPIYFLAFLMMIIFYILPTQMPFLMINHFNASGTLTGAIISSAFFFNALGAISFSKLKNRFEFATIYLIGLSVVALGFILIGLVREVHYFFLTAPMMGFGGGILMTTVTAWMLNRAHHTKRVKSSGYLTSSFFAGQFFSPIITMPLVSYFGVQHFFIVMGCIVITGVICASFYRFYYKMK